MIKDKCYIYGSIHLLLPHLENVLDKVDVVLLEGFSTKNWRELVKKDPVTIVAILGMLLLLGGQKIILSLARIYYKAFHGFQFKGDMEYVKELAKERGKVFEIADSNFHDIYAVKKSIFVEIFKRVLNFNLF
ncbi:hypothetical protein TCARB_0951 [Thermofilum adornatum 1505]|uniref:Uncharacterized protein n=2 Tax=Thermofilum TaxID=2268 RepID=A0A3G1A930_9CREN|nr:hypothetical protein [Thermofilum adornatum]AJB42001.1 hypothetical protein TCARB_0951 [Thermofilum adornatum 1505]